MTLYLHKCIIKKIFDHAYLSIQHESENIDKSSKKATVQRKLSPNLQTSTENHRSYSAERPKSHNYCYNLQRTIHHRYDRIK